MDININLAVLTVLIILAYQLFLINRNLKSLILPVQDSKKKAEYTSVMFCRLCSTELHLGGNWTESRKNKSDYICKGCRLTENRKSKDKLRFDDSSNHQNSLNFDKDPEALKKRHDDLIKDEVGKSGTMVIYNYESYLDFCKSNEVSPQYKEITTSELRLFLEQVYGSDYFEKIEEERINKEFWLLTGGEKEILKEIYEYGNLDGDAIDMELELMGWGKHGDTEQQDGTVPTEFSNVHPTLIAELRHNGTLNIYSKESYLIWRKNNGDCMPYNWYTRDKVRSILKILHGKDYFSHLSKLNKITKKDWLLSWDEIKVILPPELLIGSNSAMLSEIRDQGWGCGAERILKMKKELLIIN